MSRAAKVMDIAVVTVLLLPALLIVCGLAVAWIAGYVYYNLVAEYWRE